jgi:hypothetical protein
MLYLSVFTVKNSNIKNILQMTQIDQLGEFLQIL